MYDLIGDIHGNADELVRLLNALGYEKQQGIYSHPQRKVIFLGDFIDRGPQIRQVLEIVRPMVEAGHALSVMGNHELNALAYHTEDAESAGEFLRRRTPNNVNQHRQTLEQLTTDEFASYLKWFRTLPLWLDLDGLRVVHACWDERAIATISHALRLQTGYTQISENTLLTMPRNCIEVSSPGSTHSLLANEDSSLALRAGLCKSIEWNCLSDGFLQAACRSGNTLFDPVEVILKGKEASLPDGIVLRDKDGHMRSKTRVRWYLPPLGHSYRTYALTDNIDCDLMIESSLADEVAPYPENAKPVFIGHYWMSANRPTILAHNVACLDYSVAKGGFLCAYRWEGEQTLNNDNFVWEKAN